MSRATITLFFTIAWRETEGSPGYRNDIPNGFNILYNGASFPGVGHFASSGGGALNNFGVDFASAGWTWTTALCQADSDGDGQSNGFELGDPDCVWTPGAQPARNIVSHPGFADSTISTSPPTAAPTSPKTAAPTSVPTSAPSLTTTLFPSLAPTIFSQTSDPTSIPTALADTPTPTAAPLAPKTAAPEGTPAPSTFVPSLAPATFLPTPAPTSAPSLVTTFSPSLAPTTLFPTSATTVPTLAETLMPTASKTAAPTHIEAQTLSTAVPWTSAQLADMTIEGESSQCYVALLSSADCRSDGGVYLISSDWYTNHFGGNFGVKGFCGKVHYNWLKTNPSHAKWTDALASDLDLTQPPTDPSGQVRATYVSELACVKESNPVSTSAPPSSTGIEELELHSSESTSAPTLVQILDVSIEGVNDMDEIIDNYLTAKAKAQCASKCTVSLTKRYRISHKSTFRSADCVAFTEEIAKKGLAATLKVNDADVELALTKPSCRRLFRNGERRLQSTTTATVDSITSYPDTEDGRAAVTAVQVLELATLAGTLQAQITAQGVTVDTPTIQAPKLTVQATIVSTPAAGEFLPTPLETDAIREALPTELKESFTSTIINATPAPWTSAQLAEMTIEGDPSKCYVVLFAGAKCESSEGGVYLISPDWYANHFGGDFGRNKFCGKIYQNWLQSYPAHQYWKDALISDSDLRHPASDPMGQLRATYVNEFSCFETSTSSAEIISTSTSAAPPSSTSIEQVQLHSSEPAASFVPYDSQLISKIDALGLILSLCGSGVALCWCTWVLLKGPQLMCVSRKLSGVAPLETQGASVDHSA